MTELPHGDPPPDASPDAPPDPAPACTAADYIALLNQLRAWCGSPSLRRLRQVGGSAVSPSGAEVPALAVSTMSYVLTGRGLPRLPKLEFVRAFVGACLTACGHSEPEISREIDRWVTAWRHLPPPNRSPDASPEPPLTPDASPESAEEPAPVATRGRPRRLSLRALVLLGSLTCVFILAVRSGPEVWTESSAPRSYISAPQAAPASRSPGPVSAEVPARLDLSVSPRGVVDGADWLQAGGSYRTYLAFDLPDANGRRPKSAVLLLWNDGSPRCGRAPDPGLQARRVTSSWSEATLTPSRQPSTTTAGMAHTRAAYGGPGCDGGYLRLDVTAMVRDWAAGAPNHGLQLRARDEHLPRAWRRFSSAERGEKGGTPTLDIVYNAVPEAPSLLGHTPGEASLVLRAAVADADGEWLDAEFELSEDPAHGGSGQVAWRGVGSTRTGEPGSVNVDAGVLRPHAWYRWRVRGNDGSDRGPWSAYQYVRLPN